MSARMRIGGVPYGVGAPLMHGLETDPGVDFRRDPPTDLAQMLRENQLDAALLSSVEAFRQPGYRIMDGLCIASHGPARSVRAFARPGPIRTVALDNGSATSVSMLRIFLHHGMLGECADELEFTAVEPTSRPDDLPHDLVMMIGDCGLRADPGSRRIEDLGELWLRLTGLPMVYAVWLLTATADASTIVPRLHAARQASLAAGVTDGTDGAIYYTLGPAEHAGLHRFHQEAAALDLADLANVPTLL